MQTHCTNTHRTHTDAQIFKLSSSAAHVSVDTMAPKKKGSQRRQPVVGAKRASEPDTQLPLPEPNTTSAVKAEGAGRAEVPSTSKNIMQVNAATQEINTEAINAAVQARSVIVDHQYFGGINTASSLGMTAGCGSSASSAQQAASHYRPAFDVQRLYKNLSDHGTHECNFNIFQFDWYKSATRVAPVSKSKLLSVQAYAASLIQNGEWPPQLGLTLAVKLPPQNVNKEMESALLACVHVSPLEFLWGCLLACADAVTKNPKDNDVLEAVRKTLLTCKVTVMIDSGDSNKFWAQAGLRTSLTILGNVAKRTAIQKAMDIWESKQLLDAELGQCLGAAATAEHWLKHVSDDDSDKMCPALVDAAFTVMRRFFGTDAPAAIYAIKMDSQGLNPIDSLYKWDAIIKKAPSKDYLAWCVTGIIDASRDGLIQPGELSLRQMTGRGLAGGKGPNAALRTTSCTHTHACTHANCSYYIYIYIYV